MDTTQKVSALVLVGIIGGIVMNAWYTHSSQPIVYEADASAVEVPASTQKEVRIEVHPTMLNRIADCESGERRSDGSAVPGSAHHFEADGKTVMLGKHTRPENGLDIGKHQINSMHEADANRLGMNLWSEDGNAAYARHLYRIQGTKPWSASRSCWDR